MNVTLRKDSDQCDDFVCHRVEPESNNDATLLVKVSRVAARRFELARSSGLDYDSVADAARHRLRTNGHFEVRALSCEHHEGVLVLRGEVSSYHQKQMAQEAVRHLPGVEAILNAVAVLAPGSSERRPDIATEGSEAFPIGT